jgi:hypothetical protein
MHAEYVGTEHDDGFEDLGTVENKVTDGARKGSCRLLALIGFRGFRGITWIYYGFQSAKNSDNGQFILPPR